GSEFTSSGFLGSSALTSTTSPDTGANRSETAFTDSTTPKVFSAVTRVPTFGSSTNTTSPSCSWANAVMPTRARSPSTLAHSCSRVYLSSAGTFAIAPLLGLLGVRGMKRRLHHPGRVLSAADLHGQRGADRAVRGRHVPHADRALHRRAERAGGDHAHRLSVREQTVAVAGHRALRHLEPDELARHARRPHRLDRGAADEVALGRLHHPAQAGLQGIGGLVDVVAVERVLHLEPQGVAGAQPDGLDAVGASRPEQRVPELLRPLRGHVQLEAVLAGVA